MVKMSKEEALEAIRHAQLAECCAFESGAVSPVVHINAATIFQNIEREIEASPLAEMECDE